jgi:hypothetical protein
MTHEANKDVLDDTPALIEENITPRDMLKFAKSILMVLAILFALGAICDMFKPQSNIFEACKTILPPIATLVIGYYFGRSSS